MAGDKTYLPCLKTNFNMQYLKLYVTNTVIDWKNTIYSPETDSIVYENLILNKRGITEAWRRK